MWHSRYGHLNLNDLKKLVNKDMINGVKFKYIKNFDSEICILGKQVQTAFPKNNKNKQMDVLEIVHSDVCGPIKTKSIGGNRYFVTFIDDKSGWTEVYFMKNKSEVKRYF